MRLDIASEIKVGDTVYNCFMEPLIVTSIYKAKHKLTIVFTTTDSKAHQANYSSEDVYLSDMQDESDEEKSWVEWAKDNKDFFEEFDHIETMKEIYKIGFGNGFQHRRKIRAEELLQK